MPAKSQAQQKFMGMVHAAQKGDKPASKAVAKVAKDMPKKAAKDFASTKHKGLPKKVKEATDTVEKDEKGNIKSWKHEGDWTKSKSKEGRGKVTNLSDKARRKTEKLSKAEKEMAESFEKAISEVKVTSGPNKGKEWSPKTPGPTNPNYKPFDKNGIPSPDDGATAPPPGYKAPKSMKKAEVNPITGTDDSEMTAEAKQTYGGKGKQKTKMEHDTEVKKKKEKEKFKKMAEAFVQIGRLEQMIMEAKKKEAKVEEDPNEGNAFGKAVADAKKDGIQKGEKVKVGGKEYPVKESSEEKCNHTPKGKKCPVHGVKECSSMYESTKEKEPEGLYSKKRFETDSQRVARLAKEKRQAEKKKSEQKTTEGNDGNLANNAKPYDKVTKGDVIAGRLGKDEMGGKKKKSKKVAEGWTHDSLAAQLFEHGDEYMVSLHNRLSKQLKG
jgi:hypothetical protein